MRSDAHTSFNLNVTVTDGGFFNAGGSVNWSLKNDRAPSSKFYFITECYIFQVKMHKYYFGTFSSLIKISQISLQAENPMI